MALQLLLLFAINQVYMYYIVLRSICFFLSSSSHHCKRPIHLTYVRTYWPEPILPDSTELARGNAFSEEVRAISQTHLPYFAGQLYMANSMECISHSFMLVHAALHEASERARVVQHLEESSLKVVTQGYSRLNLQLENI